MRLFSYVVARDFGFAPNPFFKVCTLATCKPRIRSVAQVGSWVVGTGSCARGRPSLLVYVMRVTETMTFNQYWEDERFSRKKPNLKGCKKHAFGDNIYFKDEAGMWHQRDSHHSYKGGVPNEHNIENDTQTDRVLLSTDFSYWGGSGPRVPSKFRNYDGQDICAKRNHKSKFSERLVYDFVVWFRSLGINGYQDAPRDWVRTP